MPLQLPYTINNFQSFINYIKTNFDRIRGRENLKIYALYSTLNINELEELLKNNFNNVVHQGEFLHCNIRIEGEPYNLYIFLEGNLIFIFSFARKDELDNSIQKFVKSSINTYFLWIDPITYGNIINDILSSYENIFITYFTAHREDFYEVPAKIRPFITRTLTYRGEDGTDTLREMENIYGVLPKTVEFNIYDKIRFNINYRNTYTLFSGGNYIDILLKTISISLKELNKIVNILQKAKLTIIEEKISNRNVKILDSVPVYIKLSNKKESRDIASFFDKIKTTEENYTLLSPLIRSGSLYFSGTILDGFKKGLFSFTGNEDLISLLPKGKLCSFDVLLRFYDFITDNLDPRAQCSISIDDNNEERKNN